jgi:hypothetical protein
MSGWSRGIAAACTVIAATGCAAGPAASGAAPLDYIARAQLVP